MPSNQVAPPPPPPPAPSPPPSPGRRGSIQLSPKTIKRSSLRLSQSWSKRDVLHDSDDDDEGYPQYFGNQKEEESDDDDDDELIQVAFFPTLTPEVLEQADGKAVQQQATEQVKREEDVTSTGSSELSVGDASIFSNITASGVWQDVP